MAVIARPLMPMDARFLELFKRTTEEQWADRTRNPFHPGFTMERPTKWIPGLTDPEIDSYEGQIGAHFPTDYRLFLRTMNGTDLEPHPHTGGPARSNRGPYSFPRDRDIIRGYMEEWRSIWKEVVGELRSQGVHADKEDSCVPFHLHRGILCSSNPSRSTVLSIMGTDVVVYGETLKDYLVKEFVYDKQAFLEDLDRPGRRRGPGPNPEAE